MKAGKGKANFVLEEAIKAWGYGVGGWKYRYISTLHLTSAIDGGILFGPRLGCLIAEKGTRYPF